MLCNESGNKYKNKIAKLKRDIIFLIFPELSCKSSHDDFEKFWNWIVLYLLTIPVDAISWIKTDQSAIEMSSSPDLHYY